jgi:hypothetical protein
MMLHVATESSVPDKVFGCFNDHINQQASNFGTSFEKIKLEVEAYISIS